MNPARNLPATISFTEGSWPAVLRKEELWLAWLREEHLTCRQNGRVTKTGESL